MSDLTIDWNEWAQKQKPFGISGCFRLRNESQFMEAAVKSHLPYLDEAVLVVQPSDDNTVELAHQMADEDERINVYFYDLVPDWIDTPGFYAKDPHKPGHMVHMSNWALSKCRFSWICKVEGDVICLSTFKRIKEAVLDHPTNNMYYGRVVLNVAGENCDQISVDNPRNGGWDEAVFLNDPGKWRFERQSKWEMVIGNGRKTCYGWSGYHMKRCKEGKIGWNNETYAPLTPENVEDTLRQFNRTHGYPGNDNPNGVPELYKELDQWLKVTAL